MKTDIEIAQEAVMEPIKNVAARCGISEDDLELYGKYKAKISDEYINSVKDNEDGKLILVTAINPTPAGEGKTTVTVGLGEAFGRMGYKIEIIPISWEQKKKLTLHGDSVLLGDSVIHNYRFCENYYFVSGDKMVNSKDSRYWGLLPEPFIVGRAWLVWKSVSPNTGKMRWKRIFKRID